MSKNTQTRSQLMQKLSKKLVVATPLVVAAFGMSQVATAQVNCPATGSAYKAKGEAEATGSDYKAKAKGAAEAAGSAYKAKGEAEGK